MPAPGEMPGEMSGGEVVAVLLTVVALGTKDCITAAESSLKIHVTIGRCTGHSSVFEVATE